MKEDKYAKSLAKKQLAFAIFHMRDIQKNVLLKFISFVWRSHVCVPFNSGGQIWPNMAAGNQQDQHLFLSFPTYAWILRLRIGAHKDSFALFLLSYY